MFEYPQIKDVTRLQDNRAQVTAMAKTVERRLEKAEMRLEYDKEMQGYPPPSFRLCLIAA